VKSIAVVGGGISGISAAYVLQKKYKVTIYESEERLGGHTNTISCSDKNNNTFLVDTGFIVLNDCNYPILHEFFEQWGVPVRWSDMSFSFYDPSKPFYYAGTTLAGLFSQPKNILRPSFYSFLYEISRFCRDALSYLREHPDNFNASNTSTTLGEFLSEKNYSEDVCNHYLLPMGSAIWSAPVSTIKEFPLYAFLRFFKNHGLLTLTNRPRWQTVCGGSSAYIDKFKSKFNGSIKLSSPVEKVERIENAARITTQSGEIETYDEIVMACHADLTLKMLHDPSDLEKELLAPWKYQENEAILHTDPSLVPPPKCAWASWNYLGNTQKNSAPEAATLTYYMNLLQGIKSSTDFFVTLNDSEYINKELIIKKIIYHHPVYSPEALASQKRLHELQGIRNTWFCGSYFGNGFHEDGARSGAQVGLYRGLTL
jgi:uncharacterized protein